MRPEIPSDRFAFAEPPAALGAAPAHPFVLGLDLGQAQDFTAFAVIDPEGERTAPRYRVPHVERIPLGTSYPAVVAHVGGVVAQLRSQSPARRVLLAIDYTGCGRPVADMFIEARPPAALTLITITGADAVSRGERGDWRVPKRDLAAVVQLLLQAGRLAVAEALPAAAALKGELLGFRAKTTLSGHQTFEAGDDWRSAAHDDLVLALACGLWLAERAVRRGSPSSAPVGIPQSSSWNRPQW